MPTSKSLPKAKVNRKVSSYKTQTLVESESGTATGTFAEASAVKRLINISQVDVGSELASLTARDDGDMISI